MRCHRYSLLVAGLLGTILVLGAGNRLFAVPKKSPAEMLADAELHDVFFLNERTGWAVGDRGVIMHTRNGGADWQLQHSSFSCRWRSVCFVDPQRGWIVGGWTKPYTHRSVGVVLKTTDGGRHWVRTRAHVLPTLVHVQFADQNRGWACGNASSLYPAGVFQTDDGGHSWSSLPTTQQRHWTTAVFLAGTTARMKGIVAGRDGRMGLVESTGVRAGKLSTVGLRQIRSLGAGPDERAIWIVGDSGLVQRSNDGGINFSDASGLPAVAKQFDFHCVAVRGSKCWIVGSPGSQVLHSSDGGRSWSWQATKQSATLRSVQFVSEKVGFAVGVLGTILATVDGGQNWQVKKRGGTRLAMLAVYGESANVPWEILAKYSGNRGYLSAVEVLCRRDLENGFSTFSPAECRLLDAVTAVGGSSAAISWRFPLRQAGLIMSPSMVRLGWDSTNDGHGEAVLQRFLAQRIRQWRPDVVVGEMPTARNGRPTAKIIGQSLLKAIELAADEKKLPPAQTAGLSGWQVKKLYGTEVITEKKSTASLRVHAMELSMRLGRTLGEHAAQARQLVHSNFASTPDSFGLHLLVNRLPNPSKNTAIFRDLVLNPGSEARRKRVTTATGRIDALTRLAQRRRNAYRLMARLQGTAAQRVSLLSRFEEMIKGLGPQAAGEMLFQLAEKMQSSGELQFSSDCFGLLLRRYPKHELSESAAIWLARYFSSSEVAHHLLGQRRKTSALTIIGRKENAPQLPDQVRGGKTVAQPPTETKSNINRRQISALTNWVQEHSPGLNLEPQLRFPISAAQRRHGLFQKAEGFYSSVASSRVASGWRSAARGEQWLARRGSSAPKFRWKCSRARSKPRLNGVLDDPLWKNAQSVVLRSQLGDDQNWPARVFLAFDDQFLYLAIECRKSDQISYATSLGARPRDANLKERDRVQLLLDLDRDFSTHYRFEVDHRGWTSESCYGDKSWNPHWYVASNSTEQSWTIEAAIVLSDLLPASPDKSTWAVGVQRIVPRVGFQSWSQPAAVRSRPEGFGYLLFE